MGTLKGRFRLEDYLPDGILIGDFAIGEDGWTRPFNIFFYEGFSPILYLADFASRRYDEKNNRTVYVRRFGSGKDDFYVDISRERYYVWPVDYVDEERYDELAKRDMISVLDKLTNSRRRLSSEERLKRAVEQENYSLAAAIRDQIKNKKGFQ